MIPKDDKSAILVHKGTSLANYDICHRISSQTDICFIFVNFCALKAGTLSRQSLTKNAVNDLN